MRSPADVVAALDGVLYGDLFDCALTLDEIARFSRRRVTREQLQECLSLPSVKRVVDNRNGFYFLAGRDELANIRPKSQARAARLRMRARALARCLQHFPFVRGIVLTGSVAACNADERADVDLLIIVAERRLALAFLLLGSLSRLTARHFFCPNYYLSESHLGIDRRSLYVARELVQCEAMAGVAADLRLANPWVQCYFPNAGSSHRVVAPLRGGQTMQRILEFPLRGGLGDRVNRWLRRVALSRLDAHHRTEAGPVPEDVRQALLDDVELRFHGTLELGSLAEHYERLREDTCTSLQSNWPQSAKIDSD